MGLVKKSSEGQRGGSEGKALWGKSNSLSLILGPVWWREKTDSRELSSDSTSAL